MEHLEEGNLMCKTITAKIPLIYCTIFCNLIYYYLRFKDLIIDDINCIL